jgi:hypothetical protein
MDDDRKRTRDKIKNISTIKDFDDLRKLSENAQLFNC